MKSDTLARRLAATALALALLALMLSAYAVNLGMEYLEDVQTLGQALEQERAASPELNGPPPTLDVD